jgi:predicted RecA/RadA family phage recombinase
MAQTPVKFIADGEAIDFTAAANAVAGDVIVTNAAIVGVTANAIAYTESTLGALQVEGVYDFPQAAEVITIGQDVYWDADGSPYGGTALSGAATATADGNDYLGIALATTTAATSYVRVKRILRPKLAVPRVKVSTVNANGGNIATAGQCFEGVNIIAGSDNSKGVILPSCKDGAMCVVVNMVTDKTLLIYPPVAKQLNNRGANNALNVAANTVGIFWSEGANAWYGLDAATDVA